MQCFSRTECCSPDSNLHKKVFICQPKSYCFVCNTNGHCSSISSFSPAWKASFVQVLRQREVTTDTMAGTSMQRFWMMRLKRLTASPALIVEHLPAIDMCPSVTDSLNVKIKRLRLCQALKAREAMFLVDQGDQKSALLSQRQFAA